MTKVWMKSWNGALNGYALQVEGGLGEIKKPERKANAPVQEMDYLNEVQ